MAANKQTDPEFIKYLGHVLIGAKGLAEFGIARGLMTPEDLRLCVEKRKEIARQMINSGMSERETAKALSVGRNTIRRDLGRIGPNPGPNRPTPSPPPPDAADEDDLPSEEEAEESEQQDVYDHACELVEQMTEPTLQKFIAHLKTKEHSHGSPS